MARKTRTPSIKVDGSLVSAELDSLLAWMQVHSSVHRAASVTLRYLDPYYELFDAGDFTIGAALVVQLPDDSNALVTVFEGEVTTIGTEHGEAPGEQPMMVVSGLSGSHRLATASTYKAYLDQTRADVVTEIAGRHGLTAECDATGAAEPYLLQSGTDHAMLTELARGIGFEWFVSGSTLHFRKRPTAAGPTLSRDDGSLQRFSASYTGIHTPSEISVLGWDPAQQADIVGGAASLISSPGDEVLGSDASFVTDSYASAKTSFGQPLVLGATTARDATEADAIAQAVGLELLSAGLEVEGLTFGNPQLVAGGRVSLAEVGEKLSGAYYLTDVIHEFGVRHEAMTRFRCRGHRYEPARLGTAAGGTDSWGRLGFVLGVVTNINDDENLGRVKVRFPSLGEEAESDWARVIIPGVGDTRGFDVRPEVNDEVVVGFERGDTRFPFVLGGVWSAKHKPPLQDTSADGVVTRRQIVSRVGHAITISDGPNGAAAGDAERFVEITLADGETKVVIAEDHVLIEAKSGNELKIVSGDASMTLTDAGDVKIAGANLSFEAKQKITLKSGADTGISAATKLKLEGKTDFSAGGGMVKIESKGIAAVKGAMVKIN